MQTLGLTREVPAASGAAADADALFRQACETHLAAVYGYIRYRVADPAVADDLTSVVFVKALDRLTTFNPARGDMGVWLLGVARNTIRDYLRTTRRWRWLPVDWIAERPSDGPSPERAALDRDLQQQLIAAVATLSARDRDVLGLKFSGGLTNRAVAQVTGLRERHVAVIVYRAIGKLRDRLHIQGGRHG